MSLDTTAAATIARHLIEHRHSGRPNPVPPEAERLADFADAYAIQQAMERILFATRAMTPIGYKIGATSTMARTMLATTSPFYGRLYDTTTTRTPSRVAFAAGVMRVHEPEIALLVGSDLTPDRAPYDAAAVAAATRAVLPAIEIVGTAFEPWIGAGAANLIADNGAHGAWIMGEPVSDWSSLDLIDARVTFAVGGTIVAEGKGSNVEGGAFAATAWLANALAAQGRTLAAGSYVSTGTVTAPVPAAAGQTIRADFGALGAIDLVMV